MMDVVLTIGNTTLTGVPAVLASAGLVTMVTGAIRMALAIVEVLLGVRRATEGVFVALGMMALGAGLVAGLLALEGIRGFG